jgi:hypothetical protein
MHCIKGVVITFVLLLNRVGIYLYLVIANKILTNFKSNAQLQPSSLVRLTLHVRSHLWRVHAHYSPQLVERWTYVSSLLLSHTPPSRGQEQIPQDDAHGGCCDEFMRGLGRRLPVNFGLLDRCLLKMLLFIYFVQNTYYIVKMWHSFLYHYSSYVWDVTEPPKLLGPPTVVLVLRTLDNPVDAHNHSTSSVLYPHHFAQERFTCHVDITSHRRKEYAEADYNNLIYIHRIYIERVLLLQY